MNADVFSVLESYGINAAAAHVSDLGNAGGYSGANLWRVCWQDEDLCLRRWSPEHPREARLRFIHDVLQAAGHQVPFLPVPRQNRLGQTYVWQSECWWELARWLPGNANFHARPSTGKLDSALKSLALFHKAVAHFPGVRAADVSQAMAQRLEHLDALHRGELDQLRAKLPQYPWLEVRVRGAQFIALFETVAPAVRQQLLAAQNIQVSIQPCIRDIWHDHVLFTGDEVTGIVDFGAMQMESVVGDLVRLLRSLIGADAVKWAAGLAAYQQIRPLSTTELALIPAFDSSSALLTGFVWLRWLVLENRRFENPARVLARLDEALARLMGRTKIA